LICIPTMSKNKLPTVFIAGKHMKFAKIRLLIGPADWFLSHWDHTVEWSWWDWSLSRWPTGFLQCIGAVGWVIWPVKIIPKMTYKVSRGTLSLCSLTLATKHGLPTTRKVCCCFTLESQDCEFLKCYHKYNLNVVSCVTKMRPLVAYGWVDTVIAVTLVSIIFLCVWSNMIPPFIYCVLSAMVNV